MKPVALTPPSLQTPALAQPTTTAKPNPQALKAAQEFESLLLRHMLESLQKTTQMDGKDHADSAYQSMATEALADGIERGGGLGLADLVAHSLQTEISRGKR
jgi:Rod binding domain-containing protein